MTDTLTYSSTGHAIAKCKTKGCTIRRVTFTIETTHRAYDGRPVTSQAVRIGEGHPIHIRDRYALESVLYRHAGTCPTCGNSATVKPIRGVHVEDKACGPRCMGATGPSCDCSCAGQNHGAKFD